MLGITEYLWRLLPANPILLRVVQMNGKRRRDLFIRCGYLGLLIGIVIVSIGTGSSSTGNLAELAKTSANLFQMLSYCQLALVALLAPIFTAGAITQEKDSQTYDILLATPLTNGQIVLGSLMSRLFFVIALLVSGIPVFSITQIFGGVAIGAIVQSFLIAASTAFVTGAVAMAIAVLGVGTRKTIFSFYLFIVAYMAGTLMLDQIEYFKVAVVDPVSRQTVLSRTSWMTSLNPFLALRTIFHDSAYMPPSFGDLPENLRGWPVGWALSNPANFYVTTMFFISFVLISPSVLLLRRLAQSTTSIRTLVMQKLRISKGDRTRKPRVVWSNPIAWREAKTKASAARASLLRYGFIGVGVGAAVVMVLMYATVSTPPYSTYIDRNSYSPALRQLTVTETAGESHKTLPVSSTVTVHFTDPQATIDDKTKNDQINSIETLEPRILNGRYAIKAEAARNEAGVEKEWISLDVVAEGRHLGAADARRALLGMSIVEFAVILLIITNAAASTVTREKEDGTLDLLLSTPITSRYYIWGKLRGLVSFVLPLVAVPVASAGIFVAYDMVRILSHLNDPTFQWIVFPEAVLLLPGMLIIVAAFASILGMQMSLRCRKTVVAVMSSIGIVAGICALMGWCGYSLLDSNNSLGLGAAGFSPFTLLTVLIDPYVFGGKSFNDGLFAGDNATSSRVTVAVVTFLAIGAYAGLVYAMYTSMVKNFDMTIRKQSR